jgi:hypothetical protein
MAKVTEDQIREALAAVRDRKRAYQLLFGSNPACMAVLEDLAKFCRGRLEDTTFVPDQRLHAFLEGRRSVYNRIRQHLDLPEEYLLQIFAGNQIEVVPLEEEPNE